MWYERLSERYNFSLGSNIFGLLTTDDLVDLVELDPPYLKEYLKPIQECLHYEECGNMTIMTGNPTITLNA